MSAGVNIHGGGGGGYDLLAEYGEWMRVPAYGVVWCPYVDESWAPFYDGRWIRTSGGWAWDSYEPFGELVYHYGYWYYERDIGWFWVPGDEWSPARVQWYTYGNYCGWAPMPPPNCYWPDPWDFHDFNIWVVVNINDFCDDHIGRRGIDQPRYRDVFKRGDVVKRAPDFQRVKTIARRDIPVQSIVRRPMDIRVANQGVRSQRQIAKPAVTRQSERKVVAPRANTQPQRKAIASRQNTRVQREVAASKQPIRVERKAEAPARSAQPAQSRTVEKRSDEATVKKAKR